MSEATLADRTKLRSGWRANAVLFPGREMKSDRVFEIFKPGKHNNGIGDNISRIPPAMTQTGGKSCCGSAGNMAVIGTPKASTNR